MTEKILLALDIDETQIPDRNSGSYYSGEGEDITKLRGILNALSRKNAVIVHVTNGTIDQYRGVESLLATPCYISCAASTQLYSRDPSDYFSLDNAHQKTLESCGFNADQARQAMTGFSNLDLLDGKHQSAYKVSYRFDDSADEAERRRTVDLICGMFGQNSSVAVQYVEGEKDYYVDLLPPPCVKGEMVHYIARRESITPENVIVFGNGSNDISMFRREFRGVAVGNAVGALKNHVAYLEKEDHNRGRHIIVAGKRSQGVIEGLGRLHLL